MKRAWAACAILFCAMAGARADSSVDETELKNQLMRDVEAGEHLRGDAHLVAPQLRVTGSASGETFALLSAALGSDTQHGIIYSWYFQVEKGKAKALFKKWPIEPTAFVAEDVPAVKGFYWVYNCFLCDTPESGFIYKVPVIAKKQGRRFIFTVDAVAPEYDAIEKETRRQLKESRARYAKEPAELKKMQQDIDALFPRRSSRRSRQN